MNPEWEEISKAPKATELLLFFPRQDGEHIIINGWWHDDGGEEPYLSDSGWETSIGFIGEPSHFKVLTQMDYPGEYR